VFRTTREGLLIGGSNSVRNRILSFNITASRLNRASLASLNPSRILLVITKALKAALKHSRNLSLVI
jgi:hypothetical protein